MKERQSVLYVPTPDVEGVVGTLREKYDPGAPYGIETHITTLFPFNSSEELTPDIIDTLMGLFEQVEPFDYALIHGQG